MSQPLPKKPFIPVSTKPFTWVDTETTHLDPAVGEIIEIAIIRVDEATGAETVFHSKVKMERPEDASPVALQINGYTDEKWAGAPTAAEVFKEIHERGLLQDCIVAGQNVAFDTDFVNHTFRRLGIDARVDYHKYDTVTLALEHLKPWVASVSLVPVCVALGIPTGGAHGAMADCRMAMAVCKALTTATPEERARWPVEIPARLAAWEAVRKQPKGA